MSTREAYNQKMEKSLRRPTVGKAQAKSCEADTRISHSKNTEAIQQWITVTKHKLKELGENSDGA
ncbi:MAG: hypothetical protein EHM38_10855 [Geobacteraceae bacterium]|nr:MAG: hypothetical protein EHM38_10855 [Geobacteraceae bacterium]RPJ10970.1 MAG: hypothetical protein EHM37_11860 [Deltaproteobacteria bacterium]